MEFDPVLIAPRRAQSVAQGFWHDRTLTSSPTLAFGHRLRAMVGDSCCATHELPLA